MMIEFLTETHLPLHSNVIADVLKMKGVNNIIGLVVTIPKQMALRNSCVMMDDDPDRLKVGNSSFKHRLMLPEVLKLRSRRSSGSFPTYSSYGIPSKWKIYLIQAYNGQF